MMIQEQRYRTKVMKYEPDRKTSGDEDDAG